MKKIIIITIFLVVSNNIKIQSQHVVSDTLQWLKSNIAQKSSYFNGKPLSFLLDSLNGLKLSLKDYDGPLPSAVIRPDTIYFNEILIYFAEIYGATSNSQMHDANPLINTHVPYIDIRFKQKIPFIANWRSYDREGLGSITWNTKLATYYGAFIVDSVTVGEY